MFDKFFDALNVGDFVSSKHHRKPFQAPYVSKDDFRLDVSDYKHSIYVFKENIAHISGYRKIFLVILRTGKCNEQERI